MKGLILWVATAIVAVATAGGSWFIYVTKSKVEKRVLFDVTDTLEINKEALLHELTTNLSEWGETSISIETITDVDYNKQYLSKLNASFPLLANPDEREMETDSFKVSVQESLDIVTHKQYGKPKSSVYIPIIRAANSLSESSSEHKELIVYSDLAENTDSFSIYSSRALRDLKANTEKVKSFFDKKCPIKNLQGVTVYLIHQPKNGQDNEVFSLMSGFLKQQLEAAGAKVVIQANLVINK